MEQAAEPNPFAEPEFVLAAADAIGGSRTRGRGGARRRRLVRVHAGAPAAKVAPHPDPLSRNVGAPVLLLGDSVGPIRPGRGCAPGPDPRSDSPAGDLVRGSRRAGRGGPGARGASDRVRTRRRRGGLISRHRRALLFAGGAKRSGVKGRHRRDLERKRRRLEDELGAPLERSTGPRTPRRSRSSWSWRHRDGRGAKGPRSPHSIGCGVLQDDVRPFRDRGRLHLLCCRRRRVDRDGLQPARGDGLFCFKIAYDESWRRYSPGVLLVLEHISGSKAGRRTDWVDSCVGRRQRARQQVVAREQGDRHRGRHRRVAGRPPGTGRDRRRARMRDLQRAPAPRRELGCCPPRRYGSDAMAGAANRTAGGAQVGVSVLRRPSTRSSTSSRP